MVCDPYTRQHKLVVSSWILLSCKFVTRNLIDRQSLKGLSESLLNPDIVGQAAERGKQVEKA